MSEAAPSAAETTPSGAMIRALEPGRGNDMSELGGFPLSNDAHWMISTPEADVGILTEYNSEITGFERRVHEIAPSVIHYGGNAYYVLYTLLPKLGYYAKRLEKP